MKRREFIRVLGGAVAVWPLVARAQQPSPPVIGFFGNASADGYAVRLGAFRLGLKEAGYVEGQNVVVEYRWTDGVNDRLPALAKELVERGVAVIAAAGGTPTAMAAKGATATIPIVFAVSADPVKLGLVSSLNRPGGNLTGVTSLNVEVGPKRLELLRELLPAAANIALLLNPTSPGLAEQYVATLVPAANALGLALHVVNASNDREIEQVFENLAQPRADALVIAPDVFFNIRSEQLASLSLRHRLPSIYEFRPFAVAGGLISYGSDETEYYRLVGVYTGRILKGDKPADLPVQQSTKVELIVNLKTAKALGVAVPLSLLGRANEVIE